MATNAIAALHWDLEIAGHLSKPRESTGWKERLKQELKKIFRGYGDNFFDGY